MLAALFSFEYKTSAATNALKTLQRRQGFGRWQMHGQVHTTKALRAFLLLRLSSHFHPAIHFTAGSGRRVSRLEVFGT
jgi:hypothetical protein